VERAQDDAGLGHALVDSVRFPVNPIRHMRGQFGDAEVKHLDQTIGPDHDIFRFDVTMHYSRLMRGDQRGGYLLGDFQRFLAGEAHSAQLLPQGLAVNEFGGDEIQVAFRADFVNGDDIGVI
jgi:hypothetical protein